MSILSLINAALQKHGWLIARLPRDEEARAAQLVGFLVEDNADGRARRHTLRPWLWYERPVRERFEGQDCCLTVEGPIYRGRDGTGYPLGGQLRTEFGCPRNLRARWREADRYDREHARSRKVKGDGCRVGLIKSLGGDRPWRPSPCRWNELLLFDRPCRAGSTACPLHSGLRPPVLPVPRNR